MSRRSCIVIVVVVVFVVVVFVVIILYFLLCLCSSRCYFTSIFAGVLLYGPPGTGKTLLARACAAQTKSTFLKLAGPQLVQMFIGDGAKLVRDAFALAKEKNPAIIFIDELDAIGNMPQVFFYKKNPNQGGFSAKPRFFQKAQFMGFTVFTSLENDNC